MDAVYAQFETEALPFVRLAVGVRYEQGEQAVQPIDLFGGANPAAPPPVEEEYLLPSLTATWNFAENRQLRLGASKTVARPQFRELAPQQYLDPDSDRLFFGNPYLTDSRLQNLDARFEWYFGANQFFALGAFYKDISRPVEAIVNEGGSSLQTTFINAPGAELYGAEIELRRYFEPDIAGWAGDVTWFAAANYTYTSSAVKVGPGDVVYPLAGNGAPIAASVYFDDGDQLQGQSDHLANLQFGFDDDVRGMQATVLVNYSSERISARGRPGYPDLVVDPGVTLDVTFRKDFEALGRDLQFGVEARNLLGTDFEESQTLGANQVLVNAYDLYPSISFSLKSQF